MILKQPFLATGIGSLADKETEEAIELIKMTFTEIPHWPQLPNQASAEGLVNQYISSLIKLGLVVWESGRAPYFDTTQSDWLEKVTEFYDLYLKILDGDSEALEYFAFPYETARGFYALVDELSRGSFVNSSYIKGQVTGPITVGLQLTDQDKRASYYSEELKDLVVKTVALQAFWQAKTLSRYDKPVIIFIDEPSLYAYGQSTYITLKKEDITEKLDIVIDAIHQSGAYAGVHVCASTDWSLILESKTDILNFDAFEYFNSVSLYPDELRQFLEREGVLAWGLVPTSEKILDISVDELIERFEGYLKILSNKGIERGTLLKQTLITPSCGVGSLNLDLGVEVYHIIKKLSVNLQQRYFNV